MQTIKNSTVPTIYITMMHPFVPLPLPLQSAPMNSVNGVMREFGLKIEPNKDVFMYVISLWALKGY